MSNRIATRLPALLGLALALTLASAAAASASYSFSRGEVAGLAIDGKPFANASVQNVHGEFDECGTRPDEESCSWSVEVIVRYATACDGKSSTVLWSSGPITGNGSVDSGPQSIALGDCRGSGLSFSQSYTKTYGPWQGPGDPPLVRGSGLTQTVDLLLPGTLREAEEQIIRESPPAQPAPMPQAQPRFAVASNCRTASSGPTRFTFRFKRLGCWKASRVAGVAWTGNEPNGFQCKRRANGGFKCTREGQAKKYVELGSAPRRANRAAG